MKEQRKSRGKRKRQLARYGALFVLLFGGILLTAGGCEVCSIPVAFIGLTMLGVSSYLSQRWEDELIHDQEQKGGGEE